MCCELACRERSWGSSADLPQPDGPTSVTISPSATLRLTFAWCVPASRVRPVTSSTDYPIAQFGEMTLLFNSNDIKLLYRESFITL